MSRQETILVLVHGWGFDSSFWDPLRAALPDTETLAVDHGFLGKPYRPPIPESGKRIAVGHSLGVLWLLRESPFAWDAFVAVNGFPRFVEGEGFGPAQPRRFVERMRRRLLQDPLQVATDFLALCGAPPPSRDLDVDAMAAGLSWLLEWDARAILDTDSAPKLILAARNDEIVPPAMTEAGFADVPGTTMAWHETGGHLLPVTAPEWCAGRIREILTWI